MRKLIIIALISALIAIGAVALSEEEHTHVWSAYIVTKEPSCTEEGSEVRICSVCGATETETLAKTDHQFGDWTVYSDEQHIRTCSVCGTSERQSHDAAIAKTVTSAANNRLGKKSITCASCGYNYTRYVSSYDRLYSTEGADVLGDGISYIKVNTLSLPSGSERQLTLYSDGIFDIYASTNMTLEIYASAASGEFRGIKLTSGKAVLTVCGESADIDFIQLSSGTNMQIELKDGAGLSIANSDSVLTHLKALQSQGGKALVALERSELESRSLTLAARIYSAPSAKIDFDAGNISVPDGEVVSSANISYNTSNRSISAASQNGSVQFMSGGTALFNGGASGTLFESDVPWGWYALLNADNGSVYATATYSLSGEIVSLPAQPDSADIDNDASAPENANVDTSGEPENPDYLSSSAVLSESFGASPTVQIRYADNVLEVRVSGISSGYTLSRIRFSQSYNGGMEILNAYAADASFRVTNSSGKVGISVILTDSNGRESTIFTKDYEYRAE